MGSKLMRAVDRLEEGLIALLLAVMTVIAFTQVIARYVFNYSFTWALELVTFLFAWLIFIGISYGIRVGTHIGVDAAVRLLPDKTRRAVGAFAIALCMAYCVIVFIGAWQYTEKLYVIGIMAQDLPIPQWVPRVALPLGFAMAFLRFGQALWAVITGADTGLHLADEAKDALQHRFDDEAGKEGGR